MGSGLHQQLMSAFRGVCGQNPATSPFFMGYQSPLCYRCLGLYLAFGCGLVVRRGAPPTLGPVLAHVGLAGAALALLAFDVFVLQQHLPNDVTRLVTGLAAGWSMALVFVDCARVLWPGHRVQLTEGRK